LFGIPTPYTRIPYLHPEETSLHLNQDSTFYTVYLNDRWSVTDDLLIDMGLYYERFSNELNKFTDLDPRVGVAWKFHRNHILRVAYQKRTLEAFEMTLAPVTTAGLFFEWIQLFPGARLTDYQAAIESRWSDRIFTNLGYEIRDYTLPEFGVDLYPRENRARIFSAAVNTILSDKLGAFARYKYIESENREEPFKGNRTPLVPTHTGTAGLVCVLPHYVKATLSANYAAKQYGDDANAYRLPEMLTADFSATWEPMRKHVMIKLAINNIFDNHYETEMNYPAAGRSVFLTLEYRL
jgi:outer membrane receptor protein involved in Fe transport